MPDPTVGQLGDSFAGLPDRDQPSNLPSPRGRSGDCSEQKAGRDCPVHGAVKPACMSGAVVVVWICPLCGWYPPTPKQGWTGQCGAGHETVDLIARYAVLR